MDWVRSKWKLILFVIVAVAILVVIIFAPEWYIDWKTKNGFSLSDASNIKLTNDFRSTLVQMFGGIAVLIAAYIGWKRLETAEKEVEVSRKRLDTAEKEVEVSREAQITNRFTQAIEQLGSEKIDVRLGGIYALERIARESEKDHWPIMEILTAYVRQHSPWNEQEIREKEKAGEDIKYKKIPVDIQAILTVIGRRKHIEYERKNELRLELNRTNLFFSDLKEGNFDFAIFAGSNLSVASLDNVRLKNTYFASSRLESTYLTGASLQKAVFIDAILKSAVFDGAHIEGAHFQTSHDLSNDIREIAISDDKTTFPSYI